MRFSPYQVFNWSREEQMKYRKCIVCQKWGSFGVPVKHGNYDFYCGEHYFEKNKENSKEKESKQGQLGLF